MSQHLTIARAPSHYHGLSVREITISMQVAKLEARRGR